MKKLLTSVIGLLVVLGCSQKPISTTDDAAPLNVQKLEYSYDKGKLQVGLSVEFPQEGNEILRRAISEFISEHMGGEYDGDILDGKAMVDFYGKSILDELKSNYEEEKGMVDDEEDINGFYHTYSIEKVYETDKLVTFICNESIYLNGAHGMENCSGVTFRKSDGRRFSKEMMRDLYDEDMHAIIKKGLRDYFSSVGGEEIESDEELKEYILTDDDVDYLPLPNHEPYIVEDGMQFTYQPYEISFYAAGMPEFTVPLNEMKPHLTTTAREMLF